MTAAVHRMGTPSLSVPPSQNTAPVLEFNCLYTHDIRRKQKRWQDGFLRFHTFNKRVMVYDVPRNFIGDMHWKEDAALQEGDEMTLEKDAVLVQVAESVGRTETDLTELKQSAKKSKQVQGTRRSSSPARGVATPSRVMGPPVARPGTTNAAGINTQPKHRSLNALLGTPKGRIGVANMPSKSPFETRRAEENEAWGDGRPAKRSKADNWSVTRTTTVPRPDAHRETPLWKRTSEARAKAAKRVSLPTGQQKLGTKEVIDLSDDGEDSPSRFLPHFSSDAVGPASSPVREIPPPPPAAPKTTVRSSSPAFQTQNLEKMKSRVAKEKPQAETPVRTSKIVGRVDTDTLNETPELAASELPIAPPFLPASTKASQTLRMATSAPKRKTLACLDGSPARPARTVDRSATTESHTPATNKRKTQRDLLEERLAKMKKIAQQRAEDLNAVIDDADATASELERVDDTPETRRTEPPREEPAMEKPDRPFRRVVSERGMAASTSTSVKRVPDAPVRITRSPVVIAENKRAEQPKTASANASAAEAPHDKAAVPPDPSVAPPVAPSRPIATTALPQQAAKFPQPDPQPSPPPVAAPQPARRRPGIGRREIRKSASACFPTALNVASNGTSTVMLNKPFHAPKPPAQPKQQPASNETGPWTREAFDLFAWRPPGWDEEKWCVPDTGGESATRAE
ncbi:hypothetical protein Q7P37_007962 [Cladosporium fusiforme]